MKQANADVIRYALGSICILSAIIGLLICGIPPFQFSLLLACGCGLVEKPSFFEHILKALVALRKQDRGHPSSLSQHRKNDNGLQVSSQQHCLNPSNLEKDSTPSSEPEHVSVWPSTSSLDLQPVKSSLDEDLPVVK